jgi:hypothetical protein
LVKELLYVAIGSHAAMVGSFLFVARDNHADMLEELLFVARYNQVVLIAVVTNIRWSSEIFYRISVLESFIIMRE